MLVLDTQALVWDRLGDSRLGRRARLRIEQALQDANLAVSTITFWEVAMLHGKGRIELRVDVETWRATLLRDGLVEIPVDGNIAVRAGLLTDLHRDPADRFIVATALGGHDLLTSDRRILDWQSELVRVDARE
ncbi:MAG: type II toxin-antitoxin system VapC family toxin [Chloroflexi bacterium]|nr:type II toxin-antitoxin system VapC family toxin [Chloroflexota bacterium]